MYVYMCKRFAIQKRSLLSKFPHTFQCHFLQPTCNRITFPRICITETKAFDVYLLMVRKENWSGFPLLKVSFRFLPALRSPNDPTPTYTTVRYAHSTYDCLGQFVGLWNSISFNPMTNLTIS